MYPEGGSFCVGADVSMIDSSNGTEDAGPTLLTEDAITLTPTLT